MKFNNNIFPRISLKLVETANENLRTFRTFSCKYKSCKKAFDRYKKWEEHHNEIHQCKKCHKTFRKLKHKCKFPENFSQVEIKLDYEKLYTGDFAIKEKAHNGILSSFEHTFPGIVDSFSVWLTATRLERF